MDRTAPTQLLARCDTVLLDMDGTLLDLAFDNWFWHEAVPRCLARARGEPEPAVRQDLLEHYASKQGTLEWYCLDYWSQAVGLDLHSLKVASSQRIRYLPGARPFLQQMQSSGRRLVLVTNAHAKTLAVKKGVSGLGEFFECCVTSHELGLPKESAGFWPRLQARLGFESQRTLFVDDSHAVLDAAAAFGLAGVVAVTRPDTRQPPRVVPGHVAVESVSELLG
ncbi:MAG: GMP/IMP nucleotidase [Gammaproteobacteria bacterium]|nr:GMP/IMP nucleotidase [Gammaproteobacteria bacterium]